MMVRVGSLRPPELAAAKAFAAFARSRFGPRLRQVALFGSCARGERHEDSDIDIAVVVDGLTTAEGHELDAAVGDLLTERCVFLSLFVLSTEHLEDLRDRELRIAAELARDAIPIPMDAA